MQLHPTRLSVPLERGTVVLTDWPVTVVDAHLTDILTLSDLLGPIRDDWTDIRPGDIESATWEAFWRLVRASLEPGSELPSRMTWTDRLTLLEAMWLLNDLEEAQGKREALTARRNRAISRQGLPLSPSESPPSTSTSWISSDWSAITLP